MQCFRLRVYKLSAVNPLRLQVEYSSTTGEFIESDVACRMFFKKIQNPSQQPSRQPARLAGLKFPVATEESRHQRCSKAFYLQPILGQRALELLCQESGTPGYALVVQHQDRGARFGKIQIGPKNSCGHIGVKTEAQVFSDLAVV